MPRRNDRGDTEDESIHQGRTWVYVGITVAIVIATTVTFALIRYRIADPETESAKKEPMTAKSGRQLSQKLQGVGWRCYEPNLSVQQTRCYLWRDNGRKERPTIGTLTLTQANPDHIALANLRVDFGNDDMQRASYLLGETLLNGNGDALNPDSTASAGDSIPNTVSIGHTDTTVEVRNQRVPRPKKEVRGQKLPSVKTVTTILEEDKGFDCQSRSASVICKRSARDGLEVHVSGLPLGDFGIGRWMLTVRASDDSQPASIAQGAKLLSDIAFETGMTDEDGVDFYSGDLGDGQQGDFAGYHTRVWLDGARDGKLHHSDKLLFSIDAIG